MEAFDDLYRQHVDGVFRYAVRCTGRRDVAEDITSEVFLTFYRTFDRIDPSELPALLFTAVKRRSIDYWRHLQVEARHASSVRGKPSRSKGQEVPFELWLQQSKVLKPIHRACLVLRYAHGMERAEIARRLGCTDAQVKGYLGYARELLRKELTGGENR